MFDREPDSSPLVSRSASSRPEGRPPLPLALQRAAGNAGVASLLQRQADEESPVKELMRSSGGEPLDKPLRRLMESRIGADFGDVRIHTGAKATEAARSVQAHAYTVGNDVVFQDGQYNPDSTQGQKMLAHELTHVVQQRSGPVDGTPAEGGISISDPSDRFERAAEANAERVMAGAATGTADQASAGIGLQRQEEEEEQVQGAFLQRQEEEMEQDELAK